MLNNKNKIIVCWKNLCIGFETTNLLANTICYSDIDILVFSNNTIGDIIVKNGNHRYGRITSKLEFSLAEIIYNNYLCIRLTMIDS